MSHILLVDAPVAVLWVRYSGVVTLEQRRLMFQEALKRALAADCFRVLVDFRAAHALQHDERASNEIASSVAGHVTGRDVRIAWLVRYDHQLDDLVERNIARLGVATARFQDHDKALAWLRAPKAAPVDDAALRPAPRKQAAAKKHDAVELVARLAGARARLSGAQYAAVVRLVEDLEASGLDEARIKPLAKRMLDAMDPGPG